MAAYLIGQVIVHDMERFAPYVERTSALIASYGGEVLDVVRAVEVVEGEWPVGEIPTGSVNAPIAKVYETLSTTGELQGSAWIPGVARLTIWNE